MLSPDILVIMTEGAHGDALFDDGAEDSERAESVLIS